MREGDSSHKNKYEENNWKFQIVEFWAWAKITIKNTCEPWTQGMSTPTVNYFCKHAMSACEIDSGRTEHLKEPTLVAQSKESHPGLPWWSSGQEPACQCRRQGSGKFHVTGQLSSCAIITEPSCLKPLLCNEKPPQRESCTQQQRGASACTN